VEVALSQETARESFSQNAPSLAVVELLISGGAGLDLCRFFKEHGDVLVVAVSVLESRDLALEAGADAFLLNRLSPCSWSLRSGISSGRVRSLTRSRRLGHDGPTLSAKPSHRCERRTA
jgi:hypothetical protein